MLACVCTLSQSESPTVCIQGQGPSKNLGGLVKGLSPACLSIHRGRPNAHPSSQPTCPTHAGPGKLSRYGAAILPAPGRTCTEGARPGPLRDCDTPFRDYRNRLNRLRPAGPRVAYQPARHKGTGSLDLAVPLECLHYISLFHHLPFWKCVFQKQPG